jgi:hypothetical protein
MVSRSKSSISLHPLHILAGTSPPDEQRFGTTGCSCSHLYVGTCTCAETESDMIYSQYSLIIKSFGFTVLQTTLLGCVTGLTALVSLLAAAICLWRTHVSSSRQGRWPCRSC